MSTNEDEGTPLTRLLIGAVFAAIAVAAQTPLWNRLVADQVFDGRKEGLGRMAQDIGPVWFSVAVGTLALVTIGLAVKDLRSTSA